MILRLAELGHEFSLLYTPTGNELPDVRVHIGNLVQMTGAELIVPVAPTLEELIIYYRALPNWRQRWCTRQIKIEPCLAWLAKHRECRLLVGLRADEPARKGLYSEAVVTKFPMRDWGWGVQDVLAYLRYRGVTVPARTDCAVCPFQRITDWWQLWRKHPEEWEKGELWEEYVGHTFRSPSRDTWPASMRLLREEFESGRVPRKAKRSGEERPCRVCTL